MAKDQNTKDRDRWQNYHTSSEEFRERIRNLSEEPQGPQEEGPEFEEYTMSRQEKREHGLYQGPVTQPYWKKAPWFRMKLKA